MSAADDFMSQFDAAGRYRGNDGDMGVVFVTKGGARFSGKLLFKDGLCVRAEIDRGGDWGLPNESPLNGVRLLLQFEEEPPLAVVIDKGRIVHSYRPTSGATRQEFLAHLQAARNLFFHGSKLVVRSFQGTHTLQDIGGKGVSWLTPKAVEGFRENDFPELGTAGQGELRAAVDEYLAALKLSDDTVRLNAVSKAFAKLLSILGPYLPIAQEGGRIEKALQGTALPDWVANWDYEIGTDEYDAPSVWVTLYADEAVVPRKEFGRSALHATTKIREALAASGIERWPYIRMRPAPDFILG